MSQEHTSTYRFSAYSTPYPGERLNNNQDAYFISAKRGLAIVADGMGGHEGGRIASQLACQLLAERDWRKLLTGVSPRNNSRIGQIAKRELGIIQIQLSTALSQEGFPQAGTTASLLQTVLDEDKGKDKIFGINLGDSRIWRERRVIRLMTLDHGSFEAAPYYLAEMWDRLFWDRMRGSQPIDPTPEALEFVRDVSGLSQQDKFRLLASLDKVRSYRDYQRLPRWQQVFFENRHRIGGFLGGGSWDIAQPRVFGHVIEAGDIYRISSDGGHDNVGKGIRGLNVKQMADDARKHALAGHYNSKPDDITYAEVRRVA